MVQNGPDFAMYVAVIIFLSENFPFGHLEAQNCHKSPNILVNYSDIVPVGFSGLLSAIYCP